MPWVLFPVEVVNWLILATTIQFIYTCAIEPPISLTDDNIRVRFDGSLNNNPKGASTTAPKSPEKIRVHGLVGNFEFTVCHDDLEFKELVGRKSIQRSNGAVTSRLAKATSNCYGAYHKVSAPKSLNYEETWYSP
jgi:hypothetical protein